MSDWNNLPRVLDSETYAEYSQHVLDLMANHVSAKMARSLRLMNEEFLEWRSQGCYVYNAKGEAYYDAVGAGGVFSLGHSHPRVLQAVHKQLDEMPLSIRMGITPKSLELLDRLSKLTPGNLQYGCICNTGTESMECALKLARLTTKRSEFIGMQDGYHGMSIATSSVSGVKYWKEGFSPLLDSCTLLEYNNVEQAAEKITETTAAVFVEPVQWAPGCRVATNKFLQALRQRCDETGALLVLDEIQTGLGRTGSWFACQESGIVPDMISVGKGLSGGVMPVSVLMHNKRIQEAVNAYPLFINSTFAGNPLACAAALAALDVLEGDDLPARVRHLGKLLFQSFNTLTATFPDILTYHSGKGLMRCLFTKHPFFGFMLSMELMKTHHIILPAMSHMPSVLRVSPPFIASDDDIAMIAQAIATSCEKVRAMGLDGITKYLAEVNETLNKGA